MHSSDIYSRSSPTSEIFLHSIFENATTTTDDDGGGV